MTGDLSAVREVWAQRSQARTRADLLYLLYVVVLSVLVFAPPALQMSGTFLARPDVLPALLHPLAPQITTAVSLAAAGVMVLLGAVRGPALLAPFFTATLAASGIRRRTVLWRPLTRALLVPVLVTIMVTTLIAVTLVSDGAATGAGAARFVLAALGAGLLLGVAWLAGELLGVASRRLLAGGLLVTAALCTALPHAPGLGGAYPVEASHPLLWALVLLGAGILAAAAGITQLDRLRGSVLREQSERWSAVTTIATTGDLAGAAGTFRTPPSAGRGLPAIGPRPLVLLYARRDAVTWLRSPERFAAGVVVALLAAAALGGSTLLTGPLAWGAVLLGAVALWGAAGTLVDGVRHGVHTLGAPALFGQPVAVQVLLHSVAPTVLLSALAALGGTATMLGPGHGSGALEAVILPAALAPVMIAGRMRDAAKGPMPLSLMTPMPTPQGDMAVIPMLAWQSDAILLAMLCGAVLAALGQLGASWLLGGAAILIAGMGLMAWTRLRALRP